MIIETCPNCGHDLVSVVLTTYPPIPKKSCPNCGWSWTGEPEKIERVPFGGNSLNVSNIERGIGVKFCTLRMPELPKKEEEGP